MLKPSSAIIVAVLLGCVLAVSATITTAQKNDLLAAHNAARARMPASNMAAMTWDNNLQTVAQNYAEGCSNVHNEERTQDYLATGGTAYSYVGENIAAGGATNALPTVATVMKGWFDEEAFWTYPMTCQSGKVCGHWTQIIWANSIAVGCGVASCDNLFGPNFKYGLFLVCNYGPGGNYANQSPFIRNDGPAVSTTPSTTTPTPKAATPTATPKAATPKAATPKAAPSSTPRTATTPAGTVNPTTGTPTSSISGPEASANALSASLFMIAIALVALLL